MVTDFGVLPMLQGLIETRRPLLQFSALIGEWFGERQRPLVQIGKENSKSHRE
jgi:hypothetical protein